MSRRLHLLTPRVVAGSALGDRGLGWVLKLGSATFKVHIRRTGPIHRKWKNTSNVHYFWLIWSVQYTSHTSVSRNGLRFAAAIFLFIYFLTELKY